MLALLRGVLDEVSEASCVLVVGGVGYELGCSATTLATLPKIGTPEVLLYVRMRVSDAGVSLFGFATKQERVVFDKLTQISGVGPKVALAILSTFAPEALATIALGQDVTSLTSVPGVGKKTAARLLVELETIFEHDELLQSMGVLAEASNVRAQESWSAEAFAALVSMGFSSQEAHTALEQAAQEGADSVESALAKSLKHLGRVQ